MIASTNFIFMKRVSITFLVPLLLVFLFACNEGEEPNRPLIGTWESNVFVDSLNYWVIETLEFTSDSTFISQTTVRLTEDGEDLGFRGILRGDYTLNGNDFNYSINGGYEMSRLFTTSEPPFYVPKDQLRPFVIDFSVPNGYTELMFSEDQNQIEISYGCPSYDGDCPNTKIYLKEN